LGGGVTISGNISGSGGIIIGNNITTGDIEVQIDQSIKQNPNNEYLKGLKELTEKLEKEYEKYNVPQEKRTEINQSIQDLQNEVKDLKPETKVEDLKPSQEKQIDAKTTTLIEKIVDVLPEASETIANLTPLSPFSKLIKGGVQNLVDAYKKYKES
jgi:DNA repair exonuclease SbcCD ATPase subunit